jgi:AraC-like DNA-binding protein
MTYRETLPPPDLAPWVECLWSWRSDGPGEGLDRIVPDGRMEILAHLGEPYEEERDGAFHRQPRVLAAGQLTRPLVLRSPGPAHVVSARLKPDGGPVFLPGAMDAFTDRRTALSGEWTSIDSEAALVAALRRAANPRRWDAMVSSWLEALRADPARSVGELARIHGLSERQGQRRFLAAVGVSPRTFVSVLRFRRAFDEIERAPGGRWVEAALASGYFDQPQLARDFQRFLGCSATAFLAERRGLAAPLSAGRD